MFGPDSDFPLLGRLPWEEVDEQVRVQQSNREVHTPPISLFRWWARRPHALIGALLDASTCDGEEPVVADPFSGGGTVALEARRRGLHIYAQDLHPWAVSGLFTALRPVDIEVLEQVSEKLLKRLEPLRDLYRAPCPTHGGNSETLTAFWVRVAACPGCEHEVYLYPYTLITRASRAPGEPKGWWGCRACGHVTCSDSAVCDRRCSGCGRRLAGAKERLLPGRQTVCPERSCRRKFAAFEQPGPRWQLVLVQRRCGIGSASVSHFDRPTTKEQAQALRELDRDHVPPDLLEEIPPGLETRVLRRAGLRTWADLYAPRQILALAGALRQLDQIDAPSSVRDRLRLAICGAAEMAGRVSRWDRFYPKAFEALANHRFSVTGLSCEVNLLAERGRGTLPRRFSASVRAAHWVRGQIPASQKIQRRSSTGKRQKSEGALLVQGSSSRQLLRSGTIDLVLTDPPYFDDVQYAELAALFLTWARVAGIVPSSLSLDLGAEAVANTHRGTDAERYRQLLTAILRESHRTLKDTGRIVLTFHNTDARAWWALGHALRDSGFNISALAVARAENAADHSKRGRLAFTHDLVLEGRKGLGKSELAVVWEGGGDAEALELLAAGRSIAEMRDDETVEAFRERLRFIRGRLATVRIAKSGDLTRD